MNTKQRRTLQAVFDDPISRSINWRDIESLLIAVGAEKVPGRGARVRFVKAGVVASFHRPHPQSEAKPYQIRDVRSFLTQIKVKP